MVAVFLVSSTDTWFSKLVDSMIKDSSVENVHHLRYLF